MAGTTIGGLKARDTNKAKWGNNFYVEIGRLGGANGKGHKFAHGKVDPSVAGRIGGTKSRKGTKNAMSYEMEHHKDSTRSFLDKLLRRQK